ncbi:RRM domain-containing protein [Haematococcus lacustris]|uniref:RRM domain-containing protein n=1 Tax=Haematococcus lacustris TaxID=44745 RepID=A0A699YKK7_HAELA|nr:RRM domain-containing protein [Haematococcus lacustris]
MDYYTKQPRGLAFVEYTNSRDAQDALRGLDRLVLAGKEIQAAFAQQGRKRPEDFKRMTGGGGGYGGGYGAAAAAANAHAGAAASTTGTATETGAAAGAGRRGPAVAVAAAAQGNGATAPAVSAAAPAAPVTGGSRSPRDDAPAQHDDGYMQPEGVEGQVEGDMGAAVMMEGGEPAGLAYAEDGDQGGVVAPLEEDAPDYGRGYDRVRVMA